MYTTTRLVIELILVIIFVILGCLYKPSEVKGDYIKLRGYKYNVNEIPEWKIDIYKKLQIPYYTMIKMATINQLECGREDGYCFNGSDVGPYQINNIHRREYKDSLMIIREFDSPKDLFMYQTAWLYNRMLNKEDEFCYKRITDRKKAECQFFLHNGNMNKTCNGKPRAYCYAYKGLLIRDKLLNLYPKQKYDE